MSPRTLAVRLVIRLKAAASRRGRADVYVDCAGEWRYPTYLLRALRCCGDPRLEVPARDAVMAWSAVGFRDFLLRTHVLRDGATPTAPVVVGRHPERVPGERRSRVRVSVDWFSREERDGALVMPYFAHPDLRRHECDLAELASGPRTIRVGFAGTINDATYREEFAFPMLGRADVLGAIVDEFDVRIARSRSELRDAEAENAGVVFVAVSDGRDTTDKHVLQGRDYLAFLGRCDFVVAPPGYRMPLCHNLVEAMSVGCVPILNYGDWLDPSLTDGVDSLAFSTREELVAAVRRALEADSTEVERLRRDAAGYYAEHLALDSFARLLCPIIGDDPTIVVNSERETTALWRDRHVGTARSKHV